MKRFHAYRLGKSDASSGSLDQNGHGPSFPPLVRSGSIFVLLSCGRHASIRRLRELSAATGSASALSRIRQCFDWLAYKASWLLCMVLCTLYIRLRTSGVAAIPRRGGVLILSNHQSFLDPVVIGLTSARKARFAARSSLFRFPPLGAYLSSLGGIPLNRDGVATSGIKESLRILANRDALVYFPEGTRTPDGELLPFRKGIGLVLRRTDAVVVFCGIAGAFDAWPREQKFPGPGTVWAHYQLWRRPSQWSEMDEDQLTANLADGLRCTVAEANRRLRAYLHASSPVGTR